MEQIYTLRQYFSDHLPRGNGCWPDQTLKFTMYTACSLCSIISLHHTLNLGHTDLTTHALTKASANVTLITLISLTGGRGT